MNAPIALAITAGMVAAINPCGFSLLPAYVSLFVGSSSQDTSVERRMLRAVTSALTVTAGFVAVFATIGLIIDRASDGIQQRLPFITIAVGTLIFFAGVAVFFGRKLALPALVKGGKKRNKSFMSMLGFGTAYAVSSLSCTIGPFLAIAAIGRRRSVVSGVLTYGSYSLGMGAVVSALAIGSAIARPTGPFFRKISRYSARFAGFLMMLSGTYAIWYARWELRIFSGDLRQDRLISAIDAKRTLVSNFLANQGMLRLTLLLGLVSLVAIAAHRRKPNQQTQSPSVTPHD